MEKKTEIRSAEEVLTPYLNYNEYLYMFNRNGKPTRSADKLIKAMHEFA